MAQQHGNLHSIKYFFMKFPTHSGNQGKFGLLYIRSLIRQQSKCLFYNYKKYPPYKTTILRCLALKLNKLSINKYKTIISYC